MQFTLRHLLFAVISLAVLTVALVGFGTQSGDARFNRAWRAYQLNRGSEFAQRAASIGAIHWQVTAVESGKATEFHLVCDRRPVARHGGGAIHVDPRDPYNPLIRPSSDEASFDESVRRTALALNARPQPPPVPDGWLISPESLLLRAENAPAFVERVRSADGISAWREGERVIIEWPGPHRLAVHVSTSECRLAFDRESPCVILARMGGEGRLQAWRVAPGIVLQQVVEAWRIQCGLGCRQSPWHVHRRE